MDETQVFMTRLSLLIVMVKAALKSYPIGEHRKKAVVENANWIHGRLDEMEISFVRGPAFVHLFKQRVKLLCVMAIAIVNDNYPMGVHRQQAVSENLQVILETAFPSRTFELFHEILKVA